MSRKDNNLAEGHYAISDEDQTKPFSSFFKSIKLGVRLCYAAVDTNAKDPETGELLIDKVGDPPQAQGIKDMISKIDTIMNTNSETAQEMLKFAQEEKTLRITESFGGGVISQEIDITEDINTTPLGLPVNFYNEAEFPDSVFSFLNDYIMNSAGKDIIQDSINKMFGGVEIEALYSYSIPIPKLATMLLIYNILGIDTDQFVRTNFDKTKEIIKQSFESIYDIKGNKAYAYEAPFIKKKGGPKGIASESQNKLNK